VIASNFPDDTKKEQVVYFFKDVQSHRGQALSKQCGTIRHIEGTEKSGRSWVIEFEKEVWIPFSMV
jgi:uncharacterized protein (DUF1330 family)